MQFNISNITGAIMSTIPGSSPDSIGLRQLAEAQLKDNQGRKQNLPETVSAIKLLHELQVHQIELEMQNEALRESREEIEKQASRISKFYDFAPVGYFTVTREGVIVETNFAGAALAGVGKSKLAGKNIFSLVSAGKRPAFVSFVSRVFESNSKQVCDTALQKNPITPAVPVHVIAITGVSGQDCHLIVSDITERARMEQALREKEHLLSESQRIANIGSWIMAVKEDYVRWTDETYLLYGVTPETFVPTVKNWIELISHKDQPAMKEWLRALAAGEEAGELEFRVDHPDKTVRILRGRGHLQGISDENRPVIIGTVQDITERKRQEEVLVENEALFRAIAENVSDLIAMLDTDGRRVYTSPSYRRLFSGNEFEPGSNSFNEIHPDDRDRIKGLFDKTVSTGVGERAEFRLLLRDGGIRHIESEGNVVLDTSGKVTKVIIVSRDVTERNQAEEQIRHLANHDTLTELPNRRLFSDRLQHALAVAKRDRTQLAVLFLDLDLFKTINDTLGHDIGDQVLKESAKRLQECVRESDSAARIGGDEYVVLLPAIQTQHDVMLVAEKIRHSIAQPFNLAGRELHISSSIGIAVYPENGDHEDMLLKHADRAMYQAKQSGRNIVKFYVTE